MRGLAKYNVWIQAGAALAATTLLATPISYFLAFLYTDGFEKAYPEAGGFEVLGIFLTGLFVAHPVSTAIAAFAVMQPRYRWGSYVVLLVIVLGSPILSLIHAGLVGGYSDNLIAHFVALVASFCGTLGVGTILLWTCIRNVDQQAKQNSMTSPPPPGGAGFPLVES